MDFLDRRIIVQFLWTYSAWHWFPYLYNLYRPSGREFILRVIYCVWWNWKKNKDRVIDASNWFIGESGWRNGHQSHLPPLRPGIASWAPHVGWDLSISIWHPRLFLRVLRFSSLFKFDFHAKIRAVERLNISFWLGRIDNHFLRNWR